MTVPTENEKLELALHKFESIMSYRNDMYLRLAARVRGVVRGGMAIVAMVAFGLFLLLYTLATQLQNASETTKKLEKNVISITANMSDMKHLIISLEQRMRLMENMQHNMDGITGYTGSMVNDMKHLNTDMENMQKRMGSIDNSLKRMSKSVTGIGYTVQQMGHDVNDMAKPMTPFNILPSP